MEGTLRFVLRTDKIDSIGLSPIQGIYSLKGQRKYFNTKDKLRPEQWHSENQQVIYLDKQKVKKIAPTLNFNLLPTAKEVVLINSKLGAFISELKNIEDRFLLNKIIFSAKDVVDCLEINVEKTKAEAPKNELIDFIDSYIHDHSETREPGSLSVYKSLKTHLIAFRLKRKTAILFENIDFSFFQDFQNFLLSRTKTDKAGNVYKALNNTTIAKQLSTLKTFLGYARRKGINISDKYKDFKITKDTLEVIALTIDEFELLYNFDLSKNNRLAAVRDVFCFACATGLRFSDMFQLKREHIKNDEIRITVKKTRELLTVPLNLFSQTILTRYKGLEKPLPIISNQKMNMYLKELCQLVGITDLIEIVRFRGSKRDVKTFKKYELIGVHTGRKTFATLSLEKGMSAEETMAVTGHKDYKSFQRYVAVSEKRKKEVMLKAWGGNINSA